MKTNLTEDSIVKSLISLAVPIVLANILQTAYQLTDTFWVGRLGAEAVAAVSVSFPVIFFLIALGGGLAIAGTILVSQYAGQRNQQAVNHVTGQTFLMMILSAVVITVVGYVTSPWVIQLMGTGPQVSRDAVLFMQISFLGMLFLYAYIVFQSLMRGVGDVKTPLYLVFSTVLLNFILDPLFIFGWGPIPAWGVAGAAVASTGTQAIAAVIGVVLMSSGRYGIHLKLEEMKPDPALIRRIVRLGIPSSIEQSTRALGMMVMIFLVATFGTEVTAIYGIGMRLLSFVVIPGLGLSMATATLVGQNMGAGKIERAEKATKLALIVGTLSMTVVGIFAFIFAGPLMRFFIPHDLGVSNGGIVFLHIMALFFGLIAFQMVITGSFRGSGNPAKAMILAILSLWFVRFPLAYVLSCHTSLDAVGIWWAFPIANIVTCTIAWMMFSSGSWKETRITEDDRLAQQVLKEVLIEEGIE